MGEETKRNEERNTMTERKEGNKVMGTHQACATMLWLDCVVHQLAYSHYKLEGGPACSRHAQCPDSPFGKQQDH